MTYFTCDLLKIETTRMLPKNLNKEMFRPTTLINTTLVNAKIKALQLLKLFNVSLLRPVSRRAYKTYLPSSNTSTTIQTENGFHRTSNFERSDFHSRHDVTVNHLLVQFCDVMNPNARFSDFDGIFKFKNPKKYPLGRVTLQKKIVIIRIKWI